MTRPTQPTPITPIGSLLPRHCFAFAFLRFWFGIFTLAERAIPIIWSLVKLLRRSFETQ